jgi:hypothetical protein
MKNLFLFITFCFSLIASSREPVKVKVKEPGKRREKVEGKEIFRIFANGISL